MQSPENKYFYYKIFHMKILSSLQAFLVLGLLHFLKSPKRRLFCAESVVCCPQGLRCVQTVPRGPPPLPAAGLTQREALRTPQCTDGPSPSRRPPAERGTANFLGTKEGLSLQPEPTAHAQQPGRQGSAWEPAG